MCVSVPVELEGEGLITHLFSLMILQHISDQCFINIHINYTWIDKTELANLPLDKHEKALVSNVISPQDIGVTYDMIGGLEEVKEQLRQCITYPLKYPRLYQEGRC